MKQEKSQTLEAMIIFIVIIAWLIGAITYMQAPDIVPIHWNLEGNPDNFAPKGIGIFLLPLINTGLYVFLLFIPMIDPNNQQLQGSMKTLQWIRLGTHGLLAIIMGWTSLSILESTIVKPEWIFAIVALFLAFLGKVMVNVKQNYFVGIRTPWTLSNEVVWDDTASICSPFVVVFRNTYDGGHILIDNVRLYCENHFASVSCLGFNYSDYPDCVFI